MPVPLAGDARGRVSGAGLLALHDGVVGDPGPSPLAGGGGRCAGAGKTKAEGGQGPHPLFLHTSQGPGRQLLSSLPGGRPGEVGTVQSLQPPGCGNGNVHPAEAVSVPGAGGHLGRVPSRPGDQRPGHRRGYGAGASGHRHGRPLQGKADRPDAAADRSGKSQLRPADETVAGRPRAGDGQSRQKGGRRAAENRSRSALGGAAPAAAVSQIQREEIHGDGNGGLPRRTGQRDVPVLWGQSYRTVGGAHHSASKSAPEPPS